MARRRTPRARAPNLPPLPELPDPVTTSTAPEQLANNWAHLHDYAGMRDEFEKLGFDFLFPKEYAFPEKPSTASFDFEDYFDNYETAKRNATKYFDELRPHIDAARLLIQEADGDIERIQRRWEMTKKFWSEKLSKEDEEKWKPDFSAINKFDGTMKMKNDGPYKILSDIVEDVTDLYTEVSRVHNHMKEVGRILSSKGNVEDITSALGSLTV